MKTIIRVNYYPEASNSAYYHAEETKPEKATRALQCFRDESIALNYAQEYAKLESTRQLDLTDHQKMLLGLPVSGVLTLKINTPALNERGLHYVRNYLSSCSLFIKSLPFDAIHEESGSIALLLQHKDEKNPSVVCFYSLAFENEEFIVEPEKDSFGLTKSNAKAYRYKKYQKYAEGIYAVWATESARYRNATSLFGSMTPSGRELVDQFIDACAKRLQEFIENDGKNEVVIIQLTVVEHE